MKHGPPVLRLLSLPLSLRTLAGAHPEDGSSDSIQTVLTPRFEASLERVSSAPSENVVPSRFLQTEFNMDQMMPKGREQDAPKVLGEDIDVQAAETLHDVVAHLASASDEEEVGRTYSCASIICIAPAVVVRSFVGGWVRACRQSVPASYDVCHAVAAACGGNNLTPWLRSNPAG